MTYSEMKDSGVVGMGAIPAHWKLTPIKYVASLDPPCQTSHISNDDEVSFAPMECIRNDRRIPRIASKSNDNGTYSKFMEGDIAIAKVTPCFENGNICIMQNLLNGFAFGSSELFSVRAHSIQNRFLFYCMQSPCFVDGGAATMTGVAGLKRVSSYYMRNAVISLPPEDEQASISSFLDCKCSTIDSILTAIESSIEEYKRWKASVVYQAVTKGLNPDVPMKDSGVSWIGGIPATWDTCAIKRFSTKIGSGKTPSGGAEVYSDTGVIFLRSQNIYNEGLRLSDVSHISPEIDDSMSNTRVRYNDVLLNITGGSMGRCCLFDLTDTPANVNQHVCIIRTIAKIVRPEFLRYFWISESGPMAIGQYQTGGNRPGLNFEQIGNTKIPLCSPDEQDKIIRYLDRRCKTIDNLIEEKQALISELEAYKKSLIYEAVTGKRKVG